MRKLFNTVLSILAIPFLVLQLFESVESFGEAGFKVFGIIGILHMLGHAVTSVVVFRHILTTARGWFKRPETQAMDLQG